MWPDEQFDIVELQARWKGGVVVLTLSPEEFKTFTVGDLKGKIYSECLIPEDKQTLLFITNSSKKNLSNDDALNGAYFKLPPTLSNKLPNGTKRNRGMCLVECQCQTATLRKLLGAFVLVGTPEGEHLPEHGTGTGPDSNHNEIVVNDLNNPTSWNYDPLEVMMTDINKQNEATALAAASPSRQLRTSIHMKRLSRAIANTEIRIINKPRQGSKLLVLDLDYTLFDCRGGTGSSIDTLTRPYMHQFLKAAYTNGFDIVVWSVISWKWVELKCMEIGIITASEFPVCFVLDRSSMFSVTVPQKHGTDRAHEVKALDVIWHKFGGVWGPHNTLHVDDVSPNFAMNPKNGICVSPYRKDKRQSDQELSLLAAYLTQIASNSDFSKIDHKRWMNSARLYLSEKQTAQLKLPITRDPESPKSPSLVLNFAELVKDTEKQVCASEADAHMSQSEEPPESTTPSRDSKK